MAARIVIVRTPDEDTIGTVLVKDEEDANMLVFELEELGDYNTETCPVEQPIAFLNDLKERLAE